MQDSVKRIKPGLRHVLAPNASPMTEAGTNSYLIGQGQVALIDPGPDDDQHLAAIAAALDGDELISHIIVTHTHLDHSALAHRAAERFNAPIYAFGPSGTGRSETMDKLAGIGGGEGLDLNFAPDILIDDGETITGGDWSIKAHWTPGHISNHLCLEWQDDLFTGDLVMGWASSLVSPPDGDLSEFMKSLERLMALTHNCYFPGHGAPVTQTAERLKWLWDHRKSRETEILAVLGTGPADLGELTAKIYANIPDRMHPAAARNVLAHLIDLIGKNRVTANPDLSISASFRLT